MARGGGHRIKIQNIPENKNEITKKWHNKTSLRT